MTRRILLLALGCSVLLGCSRFALQPVVPTRTTALSDVEVVIAPPVDGKKRAILEKLDVPAHMRDALTKSFATGSGPLLRVTITAYRTSGFGPTRMHAKYEAVDAEGAVTMASEVDSSTSVGANRTQLTRRVAQDCVQKIVAGFQ